MFKCSEDEFLFLYRNTEAFVIGKHQVAAAEGYLPFLCQSGIPLIRRLSGGGAVYHDTGNLNFCFISNIEESEKISFRFFLKKIAAVLTDLGIPVTINSRNSLELEGVKISGNAEHIVRNRVLHHGTLLYDSRLDVLNSCINPGRADFSDKSVRSVVSPVRNISSFKSFGTVDTFTQQICERLSAKLELSSSLELRDEHLAEVEKLMNGKYQTPEWNFDYSPAYSLCRSINIGGLSSSFSFIVEKGHIVTYSADDHLSHFREKITGLRHHYENFEQCFADEENTRLFLKNFF